ncbi:alpha/beta hydrolase [uncultured Alsobacter sp.]|uniref:alpha/beta fold hydrolase n=1 Tax=uncultured Alsobacter sp. TaxID=1748258 RepID=UPI0025E63F3B|nr:alpha/beta hydrolase [uncultured Alsobacter sp.]
MDTTDHHVETPGGRLFTRSWGAAAPAPAILLFHDSLGCVDLWRDFPARLAAATTLRVVAYDRLGFGRSDAHPGPIGPDFIREEARTAVPALSEALGLGPLVLLGHSVGGAMAVATAASHGGLCQGVITIASQAFVEDRTLQGILEAKAAFAEPGQMERLARYHGDKARFVLEAWTQTWLSPDFADWSQDEDLGRLSCPLLALHGDRDEYGSLAHPQRIVARAGGPARAVTLADCGHVPHREKPELVIAELIGFLRGLA